MYSTAITEYGRKIATEGGSDVDTTKVKIYEKTKKGDCYKPEGDLEHIKHRLNYILYSASMSF